MAIEFSRRQEEILKAARAAYGDLQAPNFQFLTERQREKIWTSVIPELGKIGRVRDWTDEDDGVSFRVTVDPPRRLSLSRQPQWTIWISRVGPFSLAVETPPEVDEIRREDILTETTQPLSTRGEEIIRILVRNGYAVLTATDLERTLDDFKPPSESFPVTTWRMPFEDSDLPWHQM